jgi:hypothetical protein
VLDVPAPNVDVFFSRDTCVSSTLLNRHICNKMSLSYLENCDLQEVPLP